MKNKIEDLRNHLFVQLERLTDDDADLEKEAQRGKLMVDISGAIIDVAKTEIDYSKAAYGNGQVFFDEPNYVKKLGDGASQPKKIKDVDLGETAYNQRRAYGYVGCPHCGKTNSGDINNICGHCSRNMFNDLDWKIPSKELPKILEPVITYYPDNEDGNEYQINFLISGDGKWNIENPKCWKYIDKPNI